MSKGKDFRGPRKRGFDDDGPMSYDSRPSRPSRPAFGSPSSSSSSFGGSPAPEMGAPAGSPIDATVKWFKGDKGFGFVELGNGTGDAFLHIGALQSAGYETVPPGAKLKVLVGQGMKGAQVTRVLEVDASTASEQRPATAARSFDSPRPQRRMPDVTTATEIMGTVKWFDDAKGFGFVASNDGGKDVFVHISILRPSGIAHLPEGQAVSMKVVETPKGREAVSIDLA
ncbi:MAG: cold-shock DNA-binding domain protein [Hyphomicrobiales bacterium]|nr:cold-shock DNA-binding domain protein [Hyphomicrobiales bacterium]